MTLQTLVHNWLLGGADPQIGFRLFCDYVQPIPAIAKLISRNVELHFQTIKVSLFYKAGLPFSEIDTVVAKASTKKTGNPSEPKRKMRIDWPFLSDPECPPELRLLISDKITAYQ